jgi:MtrB/PioB family decaheme-associated outer membrane protein
MKRDMNVTASGGRWLLAALCLPLSVCALADTTQAQIPEGVDISGWICKYCAFEEGWSGEVEGGAGYVSNNSYKFGEYNGLQDKGAYPVANGWARYRDANADYFDVQARDLGLDTRSVNMEGGRQGTYKLFLDYQEIPHYISDSAKTPYRGYNNLRLPSNWVPAGSTSGMTELGPDLQGVDLDTKRQRLGVGVDFIPAQKWETSVTVRHEFKDGQIGTAGSFFFNSAQLVQPVDYVTDEVDAAATYTTRKWQTKLAYYGSFFSNQNDALKWQNAYNPIVPGQDAGQLALPPDNHFNQVLLSSGYQLSERTRVNGDVALGRMEQNEDLLAATLNPNLSVALPESSAHARVDTVTANLKVDSAVTSKLRLNAAYRYNDHDNKTPTEVWNWVSSDAVVSTARKNLPYSFTDNTVNLGADYRVDKVTKLGAGYDYQVKDRTHQEVNRTKENTLWGKVGVRARDNIDFSFKAAHANRSNSEYHAVDDTQPPENPLMRKYNLADRKRDSAGLNAAIILKERVNLGLNLDLAQDDYAHSELGLTKDREATLGTDASVIVTEATTLHIFASWQRIKSRQAGSEAYSTPDWNAKNDDSFDSYGMGVKHQLLKDRLDVGADYVLSRSTGKVNVDNGAPGGNFPDLKTDLDTVKLYADYHMKKNLTLHTAYWFEHYNSKDWMLDGVNPGTIPNVISFGENSPSYNVHAVMMSARYRF